MGRHLRKGESKEGDPQLTWTRLGDKGHAEAVGIGVTSGEVSGEVWFTQVASDVPPWGVQVEQ